MIPACSAPINTPTSVNGDERQTKLQHYLSFGQWSILIIACLNINPRSVTFAKLFYVDDEDKRQESALFYHRNNIAKAMKTLAKKNIQSVSMLMLQKYIRKCLNNQKHQVEN